MKVLYFKDFMKKYNLKNETMKESELQRVYNYSIYPRDSKINSDRGFVNIDNGSRGESHWTCFYIKDNKSYYFDSFGGAPDLFLLKQLPEPIIYHNYKIQKINSPLCGSYCLYFFYLIERMNYHDAILKLVFEQLLNFTILNMPIIVFGNSSNNSVNKIDTSIFVQKRYLRTNYREAKIEEDIDLKNQYKIKNLLDLISIREPASKNYVDNLFNNSSILRNNAHIDLNDRNITNARFIQVNQLPQIDSHLTAKLYVDNAIPDGVNESSLVRLDPDEKLKQDSIILNSTLTSPKTILEILTKNYVDNKFNDPSIIKNTDHVDFNDKDIDNVHSIKVISFPTLEEHLTPKIYVDFNITEDSNRITYKIVC